ncbi:hypothetical protein [Yinghuangia sp. YIM S10712]|uniref:hypothetical protein n=1 Tax=Yinghuangia sp. YIM S10712 TaxID=3436930 RepID=UPI003F53CDD7
MQQTAPGRHTATHATHAARQLAMAMRAAGFDFPHIQPGLLPDGSAGVELGVIPDAFAARFAEWIEERA